MIKDRGRKKWAPFLIPEHKVRIAQFYQEELQEEKPEIDEAHLMDLQQTICEALTNRSQVTISFYSNRDKQLIRVEGQVSKMDVLGGYIHLENKTNDFIKIHYSSLLNASINHEIET